VRAALWRAIFCVGCVAAAWIWWLALRPDPPPAVTFLDVGQADAIVIETPRGGVWMVDTGTPAAARAVVVNWLRARGVNRLSGVVLTHGDADHAGGAAWLLQRFPTGRLIVPCGIGDAGVEAVRTARRRGVPVIEVFTGDRMTWDRDAIVEVLHAASRERRAETSDNADSLVLRLRMAESTVLLTGDAGSETEAAVLASARDLRSDLLKVAHHGSRTSTSAGWLASVRPSVAVVSVGRHNRFGHPHPSTLQRLEWSHTRIYRTDLDGHVRAEIVSGRLRLYTTRHRPTNAPR